MASDFLMYILLLIPVSVAINYYLNPGKRPLFLLALSMLFIAAISWQALIIAGFAGLINFFISKKVKESGVAFYGGIIFNAALIILVNYIVRYGNGIEWKLIDFSFKPLAITIGVSFYSLQHIACLIDLRRGSTLNANLISYLFASIYFPKFLAGPVTKHSIILGQTGSTIQKEDLMGGFNRLLLGLFKKVVVADRLFTHVHSVFDFDNHYPGLTLFIGSLLFTVQLYFDFSGYTDMALGLSEMLGFKLPENFLLPLRSFSVSDFWRRWHQSLISFFTEYIYNPIAFRLRKFKYWSAAVGILVTFLVSGLWHGIGLPFLLWALCHMLALQVELFTQRFRTALPKFILMPFGSLLTLGVVITSNYFFRSQGSDVWQRFTEASVRFLPADYMKETLAPLAVGGHQVNFFNFYLSVGLALVFLIFEKRLNLLGKRKSFSVIYTVVFLMLLFLLGVFADTEQFIYVQF